MVYQINGHEFICYNNKGEVLGTFFQKDFPTKADLPEGTVRVDIAIAQPD